MTIQEKLSKYNLDSAVWGYIEEKYYSLLFLDESELSAVEKGLIFEIARFGINTKNLTIGEYFIDKFTKAYGEIDKVSIDESIGKEASFYNLTVGNKKVVFKVVDDLLVGTVYENF